MEVARGNNTANPVGSPKFQEREKGEPDSQWEYFKDTVRKLAQVPKEEVDEMKAEHERERRERKQAE